MRLGRALLLLAVAHLASATALAQATQDIGGTWSFTVATAGEGARIGLVFAKDDGELSFFYGQCAQRGKSKIARVTIEADPKFFAPAVSNGHYIGLRFVDDRTPRRFFAEHITLNESGPHTWSLQFDLEQDFFDQTLQPRSVVLAIGLRGQDFDFQETYRFRLPDANRRAAIGAFINACFKAAS